MSTPSCPVVGVAVRVVFRGAIPELHTLGTREYVRVARADEVQREGLRRLLRMPPLVVPVESTSLRFACPRLAKILDVEAGVS